MVEARLLRYLDHIPDGVTEVYCHPATQRWQGIDNLPAHYQAIEEFAALVSPMVRAKIEGLRLRPMPFRGAVRSLAARQLRVLRSPRLYPMAAPVCGIR